MKRFLALALAASGLSACSPFMEFNRPDPIDLTQFKVGQEHVQVIKALGPPLTNVKLGDNACDIYQLFTHGPESGGKTAIAIGEGVVDVFTLGLAEIVFTPTEIATKNGKYPVTMCYGQDDKLVSIEEAEKAVN
jgi:hypothetical protein